MKKKILHQISLSNIGGVQRSFNLFFLHALNNSQFSHSIYSLHGIINNYRKLKNYHYDLRSSNFNKLKFLFNLYSKNSIVHFYNNLGSSSVNIILKLTKNPNIIFHERGSAWNSTKKDIKFYKSNADKSKIIIANSFASKSLLVKKFKINKDKIVVIHNGFLHKNKNLIFSKIKRYSKKFSVGYLGRLDTPKGVHIFINSAKKLLDYDFFIVGRGVLEKELKALAKNYKNIKFLASTQYPLDFISKMDLMVVPSIREPLGNVIIESGFCKKPVIASNVDGIPEIIKNGFNGVLIDPKKKISFNPKNNNAIPFPEFVINPVTQELEKPKEIDFEILCKKIVHLEKNPDLREKYSQNLNNTVKEKFNIENYFENLEKIYKEIFYN